MARLDSRWLIVGAVALLATGAVVAVQRADRASARVVVETRSDVVLRVPRAKRPIVLDGQLTDPAWLEEPVRTGPFLESGGPRLAHQYSEARFLWADGQLYVGLYASDEDIRATHAFPDGPTWRDEIGRAHV